MMAREFLALFQPLPQRYFDLTELVDNYVGFSVQRAYPPDCAFKPPVDSTKIPDNVVLIHLVYEPPKNATALATVRARASRFSKYLSKHFDYNFEDPNSPTEESVRTSKNSPHPLDIVLEDEIFFDDTSKSFSTKKNPAITPIEILDFVYDQHLASLRTFNTLRLQFHRRKYFAKFLSIVQATSTFLLTKALGRELVADKDYKFLFTGYAPENVRKLTTDSIKLFEYLVPKSVAILFCALVCSSFYLYDQFHFNSGYLHTIFSTPFLTLAHGILALATLNDFIPSLLRRTLNWSLSSRHRG